MPVHCRRYATAITLCVTLCIACAFTVLNVCIAVPSSAPITGRDILGAIASYPARNLAPPPWNPIRGCFGVFRGRTFLCTVAGLLVSSSSDDCGGIPESAISFLFETLKFRRQRRLRPSHKGPKCYVSPHVDEALSISTKNQ